MSDTRLNVLMDCFGDKRLCDSIIDAEDKGERVNVKGMLLLFGFSEDIVDAYVKRKSAYLSEDGSLLPSFIAEYKSKVFNSTEIKHKYKKIKSNISLVDKVVVDKSFDYKNTSECMYVNPRITYDMPQEFRISFIDFTSTNLQYCKMNSISDSVPIPFSLMFTFTCEVCGCRSVGLSETAKIRCRTCKKFMKYDEAATERITMYATRVYVGGTYMDAYSLMPLPTNQFDASLIPFEYDGKYAVLVLSYSRPKPFEFELKWVDGDRTIQMMHMIDDYHKKRVGKYFVGLDHIKLALLYMCWARKCNLVASNCMIVGPPGCGKSTLSKYYGFTMFADSLYADAASTTIPGLIGSGEVIDSGGSRVQTVQPGILERYDYVVMDELLDKPRSELEELKSMLESEMVKSQKHNNKRNVPRRAVVIGAANIPTAHTKAVANLRRMMEGVGGSQNDDISSMSVNLRSQFTSNGINWRDGIPYTVLDRFILIFYLKKKTTDVKLNKAIMDGDDGSIREDVLYSLLRTDVFSNYLDEVALIYNRFKIDSTGFDAEQTEKLLKKYKMVSGSDTGGFGDDIHSLERLQKNITRLVIFHATMNMRDRSDESDYAFVDKLYSVTCNFYNIEDLVWDPDKKVDDDGSISDGVITSFIVNYLGAVDGKSAVLTDIFGACSMSGYKPEEVKRVLDYMTASNYLIFEPPARYRLP